MTYGMISCRPCTGLPQEQTKLHRPPVMRKKRKTERPRVGMFSAHSMGADIGQVLALGATE